jgi:hypothetical protein
MTDLTDRMRTCAAFIVASAMHQGDDEDGRAMRDAADLLLEASNALEQVVMAEVAGVQIPMEIIPPIVEEKLVGTWIAPGGPLPQARPRATRACPRCDSHANKTARRVNGDVMLKCHVCGHQWTWKRA